MGAVGPLEKIPIEVHRRVIQSDFIGHMNGAHPALPWFKRQEHDTLINVISISGGVPPPLLNPHTVAVALVSLIEHPRPTAFTGKPSRCVRESRMRRNPTSWER